MENQKRKCEYCKGEMILTDVIDGFEYWECVRDDRVFRIEQKTIRCNNCYRLFTNDDELEIIPDGKEFFKGCPVCKTDEYLMDLI